jgi:hypothetical protein
VDHLLPSLLRHADARLHSRALQLAAMLQMMQTLVLMNADAQECAKQPEDVSSVSTLLQVCYFHAKSQCPLWLAATIQMALAELMTLSFFAL